MESQPQAPLPAGLQTKLSSQQQNRLISPAMSTPPSLATDDSSPGIDDDKVSVCSERCSEAACSDCCESEHCSPACLPSCDGFVDCDDDDFCTNVECAEEACLDTAPPCFDIECLQTVPNTLHQGQQLQSQDFNTWWDGTTTDQQFNEYVWSLDATAPNSMVGQGYVLPQYPSLRTTFPDHGGMNTSDFSQSPAKRRKTSNDFEQLSQQYMFAPVQQEETVESAACPAQCRWVQGGLQCDTTLYGWRALDYHVQEQHIKPQTSLHCQWNHCEEDIDPSALLSHVKRKHSPAGNEHVCLWQGCDAMFEDADDLDRHLKTEHMSNNQLHCEWDRCGATAVDPKDLSLHLQTDHLMDPGSMSLENAPDSCNVASDADPVVSQEHVCQWMLDQSKEPREIACGMKFESAGCLQQHLKDAHLKVVTSKSNLICRWQGCERGPDKPFSQKGKLERHFVTHTGCV